MCGRFTLTLPNPELVAELLGVPIEQLTGYEPRYNIAPMQDFHVMAMRNEQREMVPARWGFVKGEQDDPRQASKMINARAESVATRSAFASAFQKRRCIVPADGFYEWTGDAKDRRPVRYSRGDGRLLMMAGLFNPARWAKPGQAPFTFTIITTNANDTIAPIHDRMPVILDDDRVDEWIDPNHPQPDDLKRLLVPAPESLLAGAAASKRINNPREEYDPTLLEPETPLPEQASLDL